MTRSPAVAGMFYEGDRNGLIGSIERCFTGTHGPRRLPQVRDERLGKVAGLVCPHAGYVYSGSAAAFAYDALAADGLPDVAVILGPNHHGLGAPVAVGSDAEWLTPLGTTLVDTAAAEAIIEHSECAKADDCAHLREHSIEVQIPFLQYLGGDKVRIVPIALSYLRDSDAQLVAADLGAAIAKALDGRSAVVIASTDLTHYEQQAIAQERDALVMDRIIALDPAGLLSVVRERSISMCGPVGTAVMLEACKALGAQSARELTYYTSGDIAGDMSQVVGYGAAVVEF